MENFFNFGLFLVETNTPSESKESLLLKALKELPQFLFEIIWIITGNYSKITFTQTFRRDSNRFDSKSNNWIFESNSCATIEKWRQRAFDCLDQKF